MLLALAGPRGGGTICAANDPCWLAQAGVIDCCAGLIFGVSVGCVDAHCLDRDEMPWC